MSRLGFAVALWLVASLVGAQAGSRSSLAELFEAANVAASRGDYETAARKYETLVDAGVRDADVFFNLATVYAQSGNYPHAVLGYERALSIRPRDGRARDDLRRAEQALEEQRAEVEGEATIRRSASIADALFQSVTEDALAYALLVANACLFACLGWAWIARRRSTWLVAVSTAAGIVLLAAAFGLGVKAGMLRDGPRAVVLDDRAVLRDGPDERARVRGEARGGDRAEVVEVDRDFVKLRVVSGSEGWVDASTVGLIDLDDRLH